MLYARGAGGPLRLAEVLVRVTEGSSAERALGALAGAARVTPGSKEGRARARVLPEGPDGAHDGGAGRAARDGNFRHACRYRGARAPPTRGLNHNRAGVVPGVWNTWRFRVTTHASGSGRESGNPGDPMRRTICASMLATAAFALGSEARAAEGLHTGDTVRTGGNLFYCEVGWPDLSLGIQHGVTHRVDVGFRFSLPYGFEYRGYTTLGMGLRVPIRIAILRSARASLQVHIEPGLKFDSFSTCHHIVSFCPGGIGFGIQFPVGLEAGIHVTREATAPFGLDVPFYVNLTSGVYGAIPVLFGAGFEYQVDPRIGVGINTRFGPSIIANDVVADAQFGLIAQATFAYRF